MLVAADFIGTTIVDKIIRKISILIASNSFPIVIFVATRKRSTWLTSFIHLLKQVFFFSFLE